MKFKPKTFVSMIATVGLFVGISILTIAAPKVTEELFGDVFGTSNTYIYMLLFGVIIVMVCAATLGVSWVSVLRKKAGA